MPLLIIYKGLILMKKILSIISIFLITTVFCISIPLTSTDKGRFGSEIPHKTTIEDFSLITHSLTFDNNENKPIFKPSNTTLLGIFKVQISELYNRILIQSDVGITLDLRKKIRELLANHFHGSRYTINNLFI
jgi:hypothetical protein